MGYRYISKEDRPSKASLWLPRTMIPLTARVESYIDTNAMNKGVEKNTLENLAEPLQKVATTTATTLAITSAKQALTSGNNITTWQ